MQFYPFSAMLARMKYISRWGLMRSSRTESLCEHTADTALLAHTLALISVSIYGTQAVSYTHLDVYKRQAPQWPAGSGKKTFL